MKYLTSNPEDKINYDPVNMSLKHNKPWLEDVNMYGFVTVITVDGNSAIALGSPDGHVLIFNRDQKDKAFHFPDEVSDILLRRDEIVKTSMCHRQTKVFLHQNGLQDIILMDLLWIVKETFDPSDLVQGAVRVFQAQLEKKYEKKKESFSPVNEKHTMWAAQHARTAAYIIWVTASKLSRNSGLPPDSNISPFLRFTLMSYAPNSPYPLLLDPYCVTYDDRELNPMDQMKLDNAEKEVGKIIAKTFLTFDFRAKLCEPFGDLVQTPSRCRQCGQYDPKPRQGHQRAHRCTKLTQCQYPLCLDTEPHSIVSCTYLRAFCKTCQRRGHSARQHTEDPQRFATFVPAYAWTVFLKFARLHVDCGFVFVLERHLNPLHHMFTLYGLPVSTLPKSSLEADLGKDDPQDVRWSKPPALPITFTTEVMSPTSSPEAEHYPTSSRLTSRQEKEYEDNFGRRVVPDALHQAIFTACQIVNGLDDSIPSHITLVKDPAVSALLNMVNSLRNSGVLPPKSSSKKTNNSALTKSSKKKIPFVSTKPRRQLVPVTPKPLPVLCERVGDLATFLDIPHRTSTPVPDDELLTGQSPRQRTYSESSVENTENADADELFKPDEDVNSSYHGLEIDLYADVEPAADVPDNEMPDAGLTKP